MKLIEIGDSAPDFSLKDNNYENVCLSDLKGKRVLLSWHPLAWTPVCTDQVRALDNNWGKFQTLNTIPLAFSVDPCPTKKAWAAALLLQNLSLPCDFWPHGKVAQDYGIFIEEKGISERANIIIDENGIVMWVKVYPKAQLPDLDEVFQVLSNI